MTLIYYMMLSMGLVMGPFLNYALGEDGSADQYMGYSSSTTMPSESETVSTSESYSPVAATSTSTEKPGLEEITPNMFDPSQLHGLNLQEVVNNQYRRRSAGIGQGFTTDIVLLAGNKQKIQAMVMELRDRVGQRMEMEDAIKGVKGKKKKHLEEEIEKLKQLSEDLKRRIRATQDAMGPLNENLETRIVSHGLTMDQVKNIPAFGSFPKQTVKQ